MTEHTYKQFDVELEEIRRGVLQMGGMVEQQTRNALLGLRTGDLVLLEKVIDGDKAINLEQIRLDDECNHIIV